MDKVLIVNKLVPQAEYNPACFKFTEEEARKKKLWRDERSMPTQSEMDAEWLTIEQELVGEKTLKQNKKEFKTMLKVKLKNKTATLDEIQELLLMLL